MHFLMVLSPYRVKTLRKRIGNGEHKSLHWHSFRARHPAAAVHDVHDQSLRFPPGATQTKKIGGSSLLLLPLLLLRYVLYRDAAPMKHALRSGGACVDDAANDGVLHEGGEEGGSVGVHEWCDYRHARPGWRFGVGAAGDDEDAASGGQAGALPCDE